jgi:UDP:flavonoid glycosyltransferase YjiC (YdhE family)
MKAILTASGSRGDVQPLLALAIELRAAGHSVVVSAPPDCKQWAESLGFTFHAVGRDVHAWVTGKAEEINRNPFALLQEERRILRDEIDEQMSVLREVARGSDVVVGGGVQLIASSVADSLGIPYRYVLYCPGYLPTREYPPFLVSRPHLPDPLNRLAWWGTRCMLDLLFKKVINDSRRRLDLAPIRDVVEYVYCDNVIVASDPELGKIPADVGMEVKQTGAWLLPNPGASLPAELDAFLDAGPPPVFVGFGSMPDANRVATTSAILEAARSLGCRALVGKGWARLGEGSLPSGVMAVGDVPHELLFPRVAAVVHHGGAGTTAVAARAGVPQVIVPHIPADQWFWGYRVQDAGLGPAPIARAKLDASTLASALSVCLSNGAMKERAREVGRSTSQRNGTRDAVKILEAEIGKSA